MWCKCLEIPVLCPHRAIRFAHRFARCVNGVPCRWIARKDCCTILVCLGSGLLWCQLEEILDRFMDGIMTTSPH